MSILSDFKSSLELSLHTKLTESALYMGKPSLIFTRRFVIDCSSRH